MRSIDKRKSLSAQLAQLVAVALLISAALFAAVYIAGNLLINRYLEETDYVRSKNAFYVEKLQEYVDKNDISSTDSDMLEKWVRKEEIVGFEIYKGNTWLYTTSGPRSGEITERDMRGASELEVMFGDGVFNVLIYGSYTYKFYYYALAGELIFCFFVFFVIMMFGIRRAISYVQTLKNEVEILEGGDLQHSISMKWNNELTDLAYSVECLRRSVLEQFEREEELKKLNNKMIADMSHDIRTPLTTVMIYQEAIKYKKYEDEKELAQYIDRINDKLEQIRTLTDTIFEYSLEKVARDQQASLKGGFRDIMYDVISEVVECLGQRGFEVSSDMNWENSEISVYREDIDRIMNNILSNIFKYADENRPVNVRTVSDESYVGVMFENRIPVLERERSESPEKGSRIGINNVMNMMERTGGRCEVISEDDRFAISILFKKL